MCCVLFLTSLILSLQADVIICSTNGELNLSGPAGKSIVNVAGEEINVEIKNKYKDGIKHGEIAVVKGYKLQCKEVYLAALSGWAPGGEQVNKVLIMLIVPIHFFLNILSATMCH